LSETWILGRFRDLDGKLERSEGITKCKYRKAFLIIFYEEKLCIKELQTTDHKP
jgi:hypothetical protein